MNLSELLKSDLTRVLMKKKRPNQKGGRRYSGMPVISPSYNMLNALLQLTGSYRKR